MRKMAIALVFAVSLGTVSGCGGPYYLSNSAHDWYAQKYGESPWLWGNVVVNGLFGFVGGLLWMGDVVFVNTYYFWAKDAQPGGDGKGSVYEHKAVTSGKKMPK